MGFYNPHTNQFVSSWGINGLLSSCRCVATEISRFCRTWCVLLFMQVFHETKPSTLKHSALWRLSFYDSPWLTRLSSKQATEIAHLGLYNLTLSDQSSEPFRCWDRWLSLGGALRLVQWPPRWLARHDQPASRRVQRTPALPSESRAAFFFSWMPCWDRLLQPGKLSSAGAHTNLSQDAQNGKTSKKCDLHACFSSDIVHFSL